MSVILILILASLVMATLFLFGFIWSVRSGQYEDTTTPSMRVLMDEQVGRVTPCAPSADEAGFGAHGVTRPTTTRTVESPANIELLSLHPTAKTDFNNL